ncbi:ABC transporter ATP-binding protein [Algibacter amylolyticus]|uniref:ABC transporter ATP-binding protein n=1 Tax=Algibacter amylolyticus TaxID=1608400 RepID=A0A5M7B247_9FLAO|nr:ABC transporter ATP-binding protein [Algibacter amylolyticus]KAA5823519.1 ABC transporter ATP-binding protein [Algibacter amylolyticus]MBB5267671.1 iron complex transport system ATP-binding protein [Algibacter amylolyticus]TSJ74007.1 ABC transporter ATP-binding protein [Algibacter amylolyticus]
MIEKNQHIILKTSDLSIGYISKKKQACIASNINIELKRGELVGLIGANGIGKSTLLRTLTQVQNPLEGTIEINDKNVHDYAPLELAKVMSLVLTEQITSKNLSVFDLVALGRQPYTNWIGTISKQDTIAINNALKQTNITELKHKKCFELSDGQLQKVMIARALAQDTDLIILDEPTTHLDMYHKAYILKLLQRLAKDTNKTILFSSHEIDLAIQLCDNLIVMTENDVVSNTPCNLISKGTFNHLFPKDLIAFDEKTGSFRINK